MISYLNKKSRIVFGVFSRCLLRRLRKNIGIILSGIFIVLFSFFVCSVYLSASKDKTEKQFLIKRGEGIREIAKYLKNESLIKNKFVFLVYAVLTNKHNKLQAGYYLFSPSMTMAEIVKKLAAGEVIKQKITIIEGWNLRDIEGELNSKFGHPESWRKIQNLKAAEFQKEFDFLKDAPAEANLEGFLFPDTYYFSPDANNEEIIKKFLANFDEKLTQNIRKEIKKQEKTIFEIIKMASLLEKEARGFEDKKLISGILWKRLKNNIPLQVDATIIYITGKKTTKVSIEETKIDSHFNTYKYLGLPLGPICNSGMESILAAIYPRESSYWYYLSKTNGETIFSQTLAEHNLAKQRYLK